MVTLHELENRNLHLPPSNFRNSRISYRFYSSTNSFGDIQITQTLVDGSGEGSASISVFARNFLLQDKSRLNGDNQGNSPGGSITINATSSILIQENGDIVTQAFGDGNAGDIGIYAPKINLKNNGDLVSVAVSGSGNAGKISLEGQEITLSTSPDFEDSTTSGIVSLTLDKGNANDINIIADDSIILKPGGMANLAIGEGNSGTTTFKAKTIEIFTGGGNTGTRSTGDGGDINIFADSFYMEDGGFTASSFGEQGGKAGDINIVAKSIVIKDNSGFSNDTFGNGNAGNINFTADYIELDDAQIISRTEGVGNAGKINISSQILRILYGCQLNTTT